MTYGYPQAVLLFVAGVACLPSLAHESESCPIADDIPVCHHFFELTTIDLPVRAELQRVGCEELVIEVLQRQGALLAPLREPMRPDAEDCAAMSTLELELPNVRTETDLLVRFGAAGARVAVLALRVYPDTLLEPLVRFAEQNSLIVYDDDGRFIPFLDENEIPYVHGHEMTSGMPLGLLVEQKEAERLLEDRGIATAVLFQEKVVDLPQIRAVARDGRTRVYVEMKLLNGLSSGPLAQKALLEIIKLAINPNQFDRG